jgi:FSR family fosmidomycin resistance protein-like MFS transporter
VPVKTINEEETVPFSKENKIAIGVITLIFSKFLYVQYVELLYFYLMHKFGLSIQDSQFHLFLFLASVAAGTLIGGPLGDRFENTLFGYPF